MAVTDREIARAQWRAQVVVIRRNQRRLLRALMQAYQAAFALWHDRALFAIPASNQEAIASAMARMWREAGSVGGRFAQEDEAKADEITLFERIMQEFIRQFGADRVTRVIETTRAQLQTIIQRGIQDGLGQEALAARINEQISTLAKTRARVIARTETHTAAMHASQEVAKTSPFPMQKRWISVYDHRTRDFGEGDGVADQANHRIMNEVTMQPGEAFAVPNAMGGVDLMQGPGDPGAPGYQVINCRCALVYRRVGRPWPKQDGSIAAVAAPLPTIDTRPAQPMLEYQSFKPSRTIKEAVERMSGSVADRVDLPSGVKIDMVNETHVAFLEFQERFGFGPVAFFGNYKKAGPRYKWNNAAVAAFDMRRDYYLGAAKAFNYDMIDAGIEVSRATAASHYAAAQRSLASLAAKPGAIDSEVVSRFAKMQPGKYKWAVPEKPKDVVFHELGHRLHSKLTQEINGVLSNATIARDWGLLVSRYAQTSKEELVAESFALYMQADKSQFFRIYPPLLRIFERLDKVKP